MWDKRIISLFYFFLILFFDVSAQSNFIIRTSTRILSTNNVYEFKALFAEKGNWLINDGFPDHYQAIRFFDSLIIHESTFHHGSNYNYPIKCYWFISNLLDTSLNRFRYIYSSNYIIPERIKSNYYISHRDGTRMHFLLPSLNKEKTISVIYHTINQWQYKTPDNQPFNPETKLIASKIEVGSNGQTGVLDSLIWQINDSSLFYHLTPLWSAQEQIFYTLIKTGHRGRYVRALIPMPDELPDISKLRILGSDSQLLYGRRNIYDGGFLSEGNDYCLNSNHTLMADIEHYAGSDIGCIAVYDVNTLDSAIFRKIASVSISDIEDYDPGILSDIAFSPNDSILYFNTPRNLYQWTFRVPGSRPRKIDFLKNLYPNQNFTYGLMEAMPNGKILVGIEPPNKQLEEYDSSYFLIHRPNRVGRSCNPQLIKKAHTKYGLNYYSNTRYNQPWRRANIIQPLPYQAVAFDYKWNCDTLLIRYTGSKVFHTLQISIDSFGDFSMQPNEVFKWKALRQGGFEIRLKGSSTSWGDNSYLDSVSFKNPQLNISNSDVKRELCLGDTFRLQLHLSADSTDTYWPNSVKVSFGDGADTLIALPAENIHSLVVPHLYTKAGVYIPSIYYDNGLCGKWQNLDTLKVKDAYNAKFSADTRRPCTPARIEFTPEHTGNTHRQIWDFGDGNSQTTTIATTKATHNYSLPGKYIVSHSLLHASGCLSVRTMDIEIFPGIDTTKNFELKAVSFADNHSVSIKWKPAEAAVVYLISGKQDATFENIVSTVDTGYLLHEKTNYRLYKVTAQDRCGTEIASNTGTAMQVQLEASGNDYCIVNFDNYESWTGTVRYELEFLHAIDSTWKAIERSVKSPHRDDSFFVLDNKEKCYAIKAYGDSAYKYSRSREVCARYTPLFIVPNSFTPNHDGLNDCFEANSFLLANIRLKIYSRKGQVIYDETGSNPCWHGIGFPAGVYVYTLEGTDPWGNIHQTKGMITMIR